MWFFYCSFLDICVGNFWGGVKGVEICGGEIGGGWGFGELVGFGVNWAVDLRTVKTGVLPFTYL